MPKPFRRARPRPNPLFFQNRTLSAGNGGGGSTAAVEVSIATLKTRLIALESIKALEFEE
jgi:hypothetical protein